MEPTIVVRISIPESEDGLKNVIVDTCNVRHGVGYLLSSSFVVGENLVLIFQKPL